MSPEREEAALETAQMTEVRRDRRAQVEAFENSQMRQDIRTRQLVR
ncbi:MAG: hypothetical protein ACP5UM_07130 [Anaerolineae bacterium]